MLGLKLNHVSKMGHRRVRIYSSIIIGPRENFKISVLIITMIVCGCMVLSLYSIINLHFTVNGISHRFIPIYRMLIKITLA